MSRHIVHVSAYFAPAFVYGGPPRSVLGLAKAQRERGIDACVVTTTANGETELPPAVTDAASYDGVPVRYCPRAWPRAIFRAPTLRDVLRDTLRPGSILHVHGLWNAAVWSAARLADEIGRPYVLSPRGMLQPAARRHRAWRKRLAYPVLDRSVVSHAARLHATSTLEREELARHWGGDRVVYVPNGVDLPARATDSAEGRRRFGVPDDGPIVLSLGRLHPIKRLDLLADAFAMLRRQHPTARLVIAGPDPHGHRASLAAQLAPLADAVTWVGEVDADARHVLLSVASAFVMCSDAESFGLTVAEAMAAAVPVVVTRTCPWDVVASHGAGFWVDQRPEAIAAGLDEILRQPALAAAMGARGRRLVEAEYSWSSVAARLEPVYEEAATRRAS